MEPTQKQDYTPLSLACSNKVDSLVRWMIEQQCDVNQSDNTGRTPLHCSAALGDLEMVKILVEVQFINRNVANLHSNAFGMGQYAGRQSPCESS